MKRRIRLGVVLAASYVAGCTQGDVDQNKSSAWKHPQTVTILEPFQGEWVFDQERTLAQWQFEGMSDEALADVREQLQKLANIEMPAETRQTMRAAGIDPDDALQSLGRLHPDLTFQGHVATCAGVPSAEYRLFHVHDHQPYVCAKAWHHEDRFDPGDMSKCYVKLAIMDDAFHLRVRTQEGLPTELDPDLLMDPPILQEPGSPCDAESPSGMDWSDWTTYVFTRPRS